MYDNQNFFDQWVTKFSKYGMQELHYMYMDAILYT